MLDTPTRLIKQIRDIFSGYLCSNINTVSEESVFPDKLKYADVKPAFFLKGKFLIRKGKIKDLSVFCLTSPKYMKGVCITNYMIILKRSYQKNDAV